MSAEPVTVRVEVTAEHIAAGARPGEYDPEWHDPIARAIAEIVGVASVETEYEVVTIGTHEPGTIVLDFPREATAWMRRFDAGEPVEPFSFDLTIPGWLVALCRPRP